MSEYFPARGRPLNRVKKPSSFVELGLLLRVERHRQTQLTYNNGRQKDKGTRKTMETIGLVSGFLLFSVLCLLPEVRAVILAL